MPEPAAILPGFEALLAEAGELAQSSRKNLVREKKPDGSIVTNADRAVEELLRLRLPELVPGSQVWGEEFGFAEDSGNGLWVVDPVDGTTNFAFGSPLWGVTAALVQDGALQIGGIVLPDIGETYIAVRGKGAWCNGERLAPVAEGPILSHELVSCSQYVLQAYPNVRWPGKWRCSGAFVVDGSFVARQRFRALIGYREKLYDIAACLLLNAELGAEIRLATGDPLPMESLLRDKEIGRAWMILPKGCDFKIEAP